MGGRGLPLFNASCGLGIREELMQEDHMHLLSHVENVLRLFWALCISAGLILTFAFQHADIESARGFGKAGFVHIHGGGVFLTSA